MELDATLLTTQYFKVCIKDKMEQSKERGSTIPTPQCSSLVKGSLQVPLSYGGQLYFYYIVSSNL